MDPDERQVREVARVGRRALGRGRVRPLAGGVLVAVALAACGGGSAGTASRSAPVTTSATSTQARTVPGTASPSSAARCTQQGQLASWSTPRLAAQVLTAPVQLDGLSAARSNVRSGVGAVLLFGSNAPTDLAAELRHLQAESPGGIPLLVMADEEGGAVQRLRGVVGGLPSARTMGATMTTSQIRARGAHAGRAMASAGVTMDLAPVLDLDDRPGPSSSNPDGTRSFGTDPSLVSAQAQAFASGLLSAGVVPVVKHFPGLGQATGNTDNQQARTLPWPQLEKAGLVPFRDAIDAGIPAVMVANAIVPGLTTRPASIDPAAVTTVLRGQLHFTGLVVTDSLSAHALGDAGFPPALATVTALNAGADLILLGTGVHDDPALIATVMAAVVRAVDAGSLSRARLVDAATHVLATKHVDLCR